MGDIGGSKGRRLQHRAVRKDGWTKARRATFLTVLAATCNSSAAARAAGRSEYTARSLRKRDAEFAALWEETLAAGYERLENELLARALGQVSSGDNPDGDAILGTPVAMPFDPQLAMQVLKLRADLERRDGRQASRGAAPGMTPAEIDIELHRRLDALAARRAGKNGESGA